MAKSRHETPHIVPGQDVIVAAATPSGKGAVGLIRMSGAGALTVARVFLKLPAEPRPRSAELTRVTENGTTIDRAIVVYFPKGNSYTGEETIEISVHGSPYILEKVLELSCNAGARLALPGEFTQQAFLNGRLDLAQAEAVCDLIHSRSHAAHAAAVNQLEGGLSKKIGQFRKEVIDLAVYVEALLDHPDEDIPPISDSRILASIDALLQKIRQLRSTHHRGRLIREGLRIAIVGRANAGKSTLLNALLGRERAIVSDTPGTTRDTIEECAEIAGLNTILIDTAGLREESANAVEREGMRRTRAELANADMALCVLDRTDESRTHTHLLDQLKTHSGETGAPMIAVLNKCDRLPAKLSLDDISRDMPAVEVSALQGKGIDALLAHIQKAAPQPGGGKENASVIITSRRHYDALGGTLAELEAARTAVLSYPEGRHSEFTASHLRMALECLDSIVGGRAQEDVLHGIFSRFCIGK